MKNKDTSWKGNCYINAINYVNNNRHNNFKIVHGIVTGQGKIKGYKIVHAWVEDENSCYDHNAATNNVEKIPKETYYTMANVKLISIRKYTLQEVYDLIEKTNHAGPWDKKLHQHALEEEGSVYKEHIKEING